MEGGYFAGKLKRKDVDEVNDDFYDFSLSSPPTKIRRLDAELPPIIEEDEMVVNPMIYGDATSSSDILVEELGSNPIAIDEVSGSLPVNEERAIVLYDSVNNNPLLQTRSPFSISVNSDFLTGFKNPVIWSNRSNLLKSLNGKTEKHDDNYEQNNKNLAVVPWVPTSTQHGAIPEVEVPRTEVFEMMDADGTEATTMDIEDNNSQQIPINNFGTVNESEGVNQWQQHCMIPQAPSNLSTPITWSGV